MPNNNEILINFEGSISDRKYVACEESFEINKPMFEIKTQRQTSISEDSLTYPPDSELDIKDEPIDIDKDFLPCKEENYFSDVVHSPDIFREEDLLLPKYTDTLTLKTENGRQGEKHEFDMSILKNKGNDAKPSEFNWKTEPEEESLSEIRSRKFKRLESKKRFTRKPKKDKMAGFIASQEEFDERFNNSEDDLEFNDVRKLQKKPTNVILKCLLCRYRTLNSNNLKSHMLNHAKSKLNCSEYKYEANQKSELETAKLFHCFECDYKTDIKSLIKTHVSLHYDVKLFKCFECDYECEEKNDLQAHLLQHSNINLYKCVQCDYKTNTKGNFKTHLLIHLDEKPFKCPDCSYASNQKANLDVHLLRHSNIKLFRCLECDFKTNRKGSLKTHFLTHVKEKLFKCPECDYGCNQTYDLNIHLLNHSKIKVFKCSICNYETNRKGSLKAHLLHH